MSGPSHLVLKQPRVHLEGDEAQPVAQHLVLHRRAGQGSAAAHAGSHRDGETDFSNCTLQQTWRRHGGS